MHYYVLSLRTASFIMVNSSWTKGHLDSILQHHDILMSTIHLLPPLLTIKFFTSDHAPATARIVYPPCDTREMSSFALLPRSRTILSVAQFRSVPKVFLFCLSCAYIYLHICNQAREGPSRTVEHLPSLARTPSGIHPGCRRAGEVGTCRREPQ